MSFWSKVRVAVGQVIKEVTTPSLAVSWAATTLVVALAGPFGTFESRPLDWRLAYWGCLIAVAIMIAVILRVIWRMVLEGKPKWHEDLAVIVSMALVFGPLIVWINRFLIAPGTHGDLGVVVATVMVFAISAVIVVVRSAIHEAGQVQAQQRRDRLLERIEAPHGTRLYRISSDNHHIRVLTSDGDERRVLMRLGDAIQEVDVEQGMCVHRSHWVARHAISHVKRVDGREVIELACGAHVPVGPKYRPNLVGAGVLTD